MGLYSWAEVHNPQLPSVRKADALKNTNWSLLQNLHWKADSLKSGLNCSSLNASLLERMSSPLKLPFTVGGLESLMTTPKQIRLIRLPLGGNFSSTNQGCHWLAICLWHHQWPKKPFHRMAWVGTDLKVYRVPTFKLDSSSLSPCCPYTSLKPKLSFPFLACDTQTWPPEQSSLPHVIPLS